ncbi:MAG: hypothetical protein EBZ60_03960, partial [Betaproteobacteria bacterium]|nr:hypothetical protein [Betaproteobacteria bacterium]
IDIALDKAYTAASFGLPTGQWTEVLKHHSPAVGEGLVMRPRFVAFGGGLPIVHQTHRRGMVFEHFGPLPGGQAKAGCGVGLVQGDIDRMQGCAVHAQKTHHDTRTVGQRDVDVHAQGLRFGRRCR